MTYPLVESIPNYSEGRRLEVVQQIADAILSVPGVTILDRHSDPDHNRTVMTLLGHPKDVSEAVFRSISEAAELIDMDAHHGEHPRIGAADVVPFVPIRDLSMQQCVNLARALGRRVGDELGIPVYLYEEAATSPERINLENLRKGQYEGLRQEIETVPSRKPDFGPSKMGKAGATVIGARAALIAFNVYLTTDDVSVAKAIAKTIRFSSGGLRFVKAMGVEVEGRAQVSMNLTNFKKTPISLVVETIRREAARFGVAIHHSELVGLVPQEALLDAALWYTQLDQFESGQVLENQLTMAVEAKAGPYSFLDDLASPQPTPGGGSAAAFSAAEAAALVAMVAGVTLGKKKYEAVGASMQALMQSAEGLRQRLTRAIESDAASFSALMAAFRLPKETPEEKSSRAEAVVQGSLHAARVPLQTSGMALEALNYALEAAEKGNINAITDAATAGALCLAAISAAGANVRVNLSALKGNPQAEEMLAEASRLENEAQGHYAQLKKILKTRAEIDLA